MSAVAAEPIKTEYITKITELMQKCEDTALLDLILQLLQKC